MGLFLLRAYPALLMGGAVFCLAAFPFILRARARSARMKIPLAAACVIVALTGLHAARSSLREPVQHVFYDQLEHADIAGNLARYGVWGVTEIGGKDDWTVFKVPCWPGLHHVTIAAASRLSGLPAARAARVNLALAASCVPLLFLLAVMLLDDWLAAVLAAALLAASPLLAHFALSGDLTAPALFWMLLFLCAACAAWQSGRTSARLAVLVFAAVCAHSRPEAALCWLAPLAVALARRGRLVRPSAAMLAGTTAIAAAALFPLAPIMAMNPTTGLNFQSRSGLQGLGTILDAVVSNILYSTGGLPLAPIILLLAVAGAASIWRSHRPAAAGLLCLIFVYAAFFALMPFGRFDFWISCKYALPGHAATLLLAGAGLSATSRRLGGGRVGALATAAALALAAGDLGRLTSSLPSEEGTASVQQRAMALTDRTEADSYVIALSAPAVRVLTGRAAISGRVFTEDPDDVGRHLHQAPTPLYLLHDPWWNAYPDRARRLEAAAREHYRLVRVSGFQDDDSLFSLYRLEPKG